MILMLISGAYAADPAPATPPAAPAPAKAAPAAPAAPAAAAPKFADLDKNHDKMLAKDEVTSVAAVVTAWATLDTDKNGSLSEAEYKVWADKAGAAPATPAAPAPAKAAPAAPAPAAPAPK